MNTKQETIIEARDLLVGQKIDYLLVAEHDNEVMVAYTANSPQIGLLSMLARAIMHGDGLSTDIEDRLVAIGNDLSRGTIQ